MIIKTGAVIYRNYERYKNKVYEQLSTRFTVGAPYIFYSYGVQVMGFELIADNGDVVQETDFSLYDTEPEYALVEWYS